MSRIDGVTVSERRLTNVAICGAGIAGLALGIRLAGMGYKPVVFEARSEAAAGREGVFLTLAPNGANGLRAIGCYDLVKKNGIDTTGIEILNAKGKRLALADQSDHEREFGAPSITIRRGLLTEILLSQARAVGVDVRFDVRVRGVAASPAAVRLMLSDGRTHDADILVASDGLRSNVREIVFPEYPRPHYTGLIGTGGITEAKIAHTGGLMRMTFGSNAFFGYVKPAGQPRPTRSGPMLGRELPWPSKMASFSPHALRRNKTMTPHSAVMKGCAAIGSNRS